MKEIKTILVPVDFSEVSKKALKVASMLAANINAGILLLHTYHAGEVSVDYINSLKSDHEDDLKIKANSQMNTMIDELGNNGVSIEYITVYGPLAEVVETLAADNKVGMIVMGTSGSKGFFDTFLGTKTSRIIERVHCPVLSVPFNGNFNGFDPIVFATDFHHCDMEVMKFLVWFAEIFHSGIRIVHISKISGITGNEEKLMEKFSEEVKTKIGNAEIVYEMLNGKNVTSELENYILDIKAGLLVMSTHHRGVFDHIFEKSNTREIATRAMIPLMAFHYKKEDTYLF